MDQTKEALVALHEVDRARAWENVTQEEGGGLAGSNLCEFPVLVAVAAEGSGIWILATSQRLSTLEP